MKSKADTVRTLRGLHVIDIGGAGAGVENRYEIEMREAWKGCHRLCVDKSPDAGIVIDFDVLPLDSWGPQYDVATVLGVLEHLEHPVAVLRWIRANRLIVTLPNSQSWIARRMEEKNGFEHLYSFTPYTATTMLKAGGWNVDKIYYHFGKWSILARLINAVGSLWPSRVGTGLVLCCSRPTAERAE